jgi:hypothetical protein
MPPVKPSLPTDTKFGDSPAVATQSAVHANLNHQLWDISGISGQCPWERDKQPGHERQHQPDSCATTPETGRSTPMGKSWGK